MASALLAYMMYLRNLTEPDMFGKVVQWDHPCPRFCQAAREALGRGWIRRRWWLFGPVGLIRGGHLALLQRRVP